MQWNKSPSANQGTHKIAVPLALQKKLQIVSKFTIL
jgi:hypothetical protein